jgi:putative transposase
MRKILLYLLDSVLSSFRSRATLQLEIIALRHQLEVLERNRPTRVRLIRLDRALWILLYRLWPRCLSAVVIVKPETVIAWHRKGFRAFWTWKSRPRRRGRPPVPVDVRDLIQRMCRENPLWGAPRIHGELLKLGIEFSQAAVSKYMIRHPKPPSQTWRIFLRNHVGCLASVDFFVVPTATFQLLFVFIVLHHERRHIVHFGVTAHPTSHWASQQIREAFPWETAPRYLIRDRGGSYGAVFVSRLRGMGINEVLTAPRSPWQNAYVERVIGSIRRECLDHIIILSERHFRRILSSYFAYYHRSRTHLSLEKDCPVPRPVRLPDAGKVITFPQVGGLHHRYEWLAA